MDYGTSAQFVTSLVKSLHVMCNGYVEFDTWVQVRGQLYLDTDTGKSIEFVIDEKVCKTNEATEGNKPTPRVETYEAPAQQQQQVQQPQQVQHHQHQQAQQQLQTQQQLGKQETIHQDFEIFEPLEPPGNIHDLVQAARHTDPNFQYTYAGAEAYMPTTPQTTTVPVTAVTNKAFMENAANVKTPVRRSGQGYQRPESAGEGPHKCDICGKGFTREANVKIHRRLHTGERPYECNVCGARHNTPKDLKVHQRVHTGERPYSCGVCGKAFAQLATLKSHQTTHNKQNKIYKCDICGKGFHRKDGVNAHKKQVHQYADNNKCKHCDAQFNSKEELKEHKSQVHRKFKARPEGEEVKWYQCKFCTKQFDKKHRLWAHQKLHQQEDENQCPVCGETFDNKLKLLIHKNKHAAQKLTIVGKKKLPMANNMAKIAAAARERANAENEMKTPK